MSGSEVTFCDRPSLSRDFRMPYAWTRVQRRIDFDAPGGCWIWTGSRLPEPHAYGRTTGLDGKSCMAHRLVYTLLVADIPKGIELHHECGNEPCVNPAHLRPVTAKEHHRLNPRSIANQNRQKTHCPQGHEYTDETTWAMVPKRYPHRYDRVCMECYPNRRNLITVAEWKAQREEVAS